MATTNFTTGTTITAAWLNEVDALVHDVFSGATTDAEARTNIGLTANSGSSLIGYTQGGSGASDRTIQNKLREHVSVKDFGAVGDGVTDDTAAIQAAFNYAEGQSTALYFPAGKYICSSALTYQQTAAAAQNYSLKIYGDGHSLTELAFTGATNGIVIIYDNWKAGLCEVRDLYIGTSYVGASLTALSITATTYTSTGSHMGPVVDNVRIGANYSANANNSYWTNGIYCEKMPHLSVRNCWLAGNPDASLGNGIQLHDWVISPSIHNTNIYTWNKGIYITGYQTEGVNVSHSWIIACYDGIYSDTSATGTETALAVTNTALDIDHYGIYLNARENVKITACGFYRQDNDTAGYTDIYLHDASNLVITGNFFRRDGGGTNPATIFKCVTGSNAVIVGNWGVSRDTAVDIASTFTRVTHVGNNWDGVTTEIVDATLEANKDINVLATKYAASTAHTMLQMAAGGDIIATGTETVVDNWGSNSQTHSPCSFTTDDRSKISVPGTIRKVVVKANIAFPSNSTGYRYVTILKDGSSVFGGTKVVQNAVNGTTTNIQVVSAPIEVTADCYFQIAVYQNSGGDLTIPAGSTSYFSVEVVE